MSPEDFIDDSASAKARLSSHANPTSDSGCPVHGWVIQRSICSDCNAAYMRAYLRRRRRDDPTKELYERARKRAHKLQVPFAIKLAEIEIPVSCPALGIMLSVGKGRSNHSPSLDRIIPALGYVSGNVRVISDRANRMKGRCGLDELRDRSIRGSKELQSEYGLIATYLEREMLLATVLQHANGRSRARSHWRQVAKILADVCTFGLPSVLSNQNPPAGAIA